MQQELQQKELTFQAKLKQREQELTLKADTRETELQNQWVSDLRAREEEWSEALRFAAAHLFAWFSYGSDRHFDLICQNLVEPQPNWILTSRPHGQESPSTSISRSMATQAQHHHAHRWRNQRRLSSSGTRLTN